MTSDDFKLFRMALGLTPLQLAKLFKVKRGYIYRIEADAGAVNTRRVPFLMELLMRAYLDGYRPKDWPLTKEGSE